ncbi:MAG TPA: carboxypeptidase regulatory-like domain-containing protein [Kofleriaceae bacterium]|nr:carboxypeptidase regulatory-like domain-containing protein [Kofleriaceae bacterium]
MRRRNLYIAAGAAAVLLAWVGWKVVGGDEESSAEQAGSGGGADDPDSPAARRMRAMSGGGMGRVSGAVLDATDRKPIAGVDVTFGNAFGESTATSGPDGRYALALGPGAYRVLAVGDAVLGAGAGRFEIGPGQKVDGYDILVSRLARLRGRVLDHRGAPVSGARVTYGARMGGRPIGSEQTAPVGEATSGDGGAFEIEVPAGDVKLIAEIGEARGEALVGGVLPGQEPGEVIIRLAAGASVDGRVVDAARAPVGGAEVRVVMARGDAADGERTATTDGSGRFRFDHLAPGRAILEARTATGVSAPLTVELVDARERGGVELVLAGAGSIAGRVVDGKGAPLPGATVLANPSSASRAKSRPAISGADGAFRLEGLAAGVAHNVQARRDGYPNTFVRNVMPPADKVELVMLSAGGIRGVVKGAGGARVGSFQVKVERYLEADGVMRPGSAASRYSSSDGRFELDLVAPGAYDLVVTADGFAPARPARVTVPADGWVDITVELAAAARVSGRVTSSGKPVAGARVAMSAGYEGPPVFTDGQGRFALIDVAPGRRSISASKAGLASGHRDDVEVRAGQTTEVELALGDGGGKKEGGIGVTLALSSQARPSVARVVARGPGARAGLRRGDVVMAIDGVVTLNLPVDQAAAMLRGPAGSPVRIEVERAGNPLRFDVARAPD